MARRLTQKREGFVQDVFKDVTQGQAYMNHFKVKSMAVATACASRLLTKAKIKDRLAELRKKVEDAAIMDKQELLKVHTEVARGRVGHFLNEQNRVKQDADKNNASIQEFNTFDITIGKGESAKLAEVTKIKLHDPVRSMQEIAKLQGFYPKEGTGASNYIDNRVINFIMPEKKSESLIEGIAKRLQEGTEQEEDKE